MPLWGVGLRLLQPPVGTGLSAGDGQRTPKYNKKDSLFPCVQSNVELHGGKPRKEQRPCNVLKQWLSPFVFL